jgi:hypothetical protein
MLAKHTVGVRALGLSSKGVAPFARRSRALTTQVRAQGNGLNIDLRGEAARRRGRGEGPTIARAAGPGRGARSRSCGVHQS